MLHLRTIPLATLLLAVCTVLAGGPAAARDRDRDRGDSGGVGSSWCQQNPDRCEQMKKKRSQYCERNPQSCDTANDDWKGRRTYCDRNPDKCQELRQEARERRNALKSYCDEHQDECDRKKQEFRNDLEKRRGSR